MAAIKSIIFDLGGVLLNLDTGKTRNAFIQLGLTSIDELFHIGYAASFFKEYEVGKLTDEQFVQDALKLCKPGTTEQQVLDAWNSMLLDFPKERVDFLDKLKNNYQLFLFSNTNTIHMEHFLKSFYAVYGRTMNSLFEKAYYSQIIQLRKPDVEAFKYVIKDSGVDAGSTLFIDDAPVNVEGARQAGLQAVHLESGKTILDLGL